MIFQKVSVIILHYNAVSDTLRCLESLRAIDYSDYEIILIDNASGDDALEMVRKYPGIILIKNEENLGYAGGNNTGIEYALKNGASYVWLLNNDTIVEPNTLRELICAGQEDESVGLLSPVIFDYGPLGSIQ